VPYKYLLSQVAETGKPTMIKANSIAARIPGVPKVKDPDTFIEHSEDRMLLASIYSGVGDARRWRMGSI